MTVTRNALRRQTRAGTGWVLWLLYICDAGLLAAVAVLAIRRLMVVAGAALLMAGTIVGFLLARSVGIYSAFISPSAPAWPIRCWPSRPWRSCFSA